MNNIKQLRETRGFTQEKLARELKVTQSAVAKWEVGNVQPRANMLVKLAQLFGCTVDELLKMEAKGNEPDDAA